MKNKVKDFFRKELKYTIFFAVLLIVTLGIATTTYQYDDFSLQLPFKTLYGSLIYTIILSFGIIIYLLFRKNFYNKIKIVFLYQYLMHLQYQKVLLKTSF